MKMDRKSSFILSGKGSTNRVQIASVQYKGYYVLKYYTHRKVYMQADNYSADGASTADTHLSLIHI